MRRALSGLTGMLTRVLIVANCAAICAAIVAAAWPATAAAAPNFADRPEVREFAREVAERNGMKEERVLRILRKATRLPAVLRAIAPSADPLRHSWQDYRALFVNDARIDRGAEFWEHYAATLARAREEFGIPEEILVAIIGIETVYGRNIGRYRVLDALATLAFDYPRRADFFRAELEQFLLLTSELVTDPLAAKGSYAGAIGIPQFMPGSVRRFAIDYDGDGRADIAASPEDAIGSVANFLAHHGWVRNLAIAWRASVSPDGIEDLIAAGIKPQFAFADLVTRGVTVEGVPPAAETALALVDLPSRAVPVEFRLASGNFYTITRYNRSSFYAAAVTDLAMELRQRRDLARNTPAEPLTREFSAAPR
jgi:membrane-bound lytic murein transglycosylase B